MSAGAGDDRSEWLAMARSKLLVEEAGKLPEEACLILFQAISDASLSNQASMIEMEDDEGLVEYRNDAVPAGVFSLSPMPPLGHEFWRFGNLRISARVLEDGAIIDIGGHRMVLPMGGLLPDITIRGLKVSREGVEGLCRSLRKPEGRGRRIGSGGYAEADEPLILEMRDWLRAEPGRGVNEAVYRVVDRAAGRGQTTSKAARLLLRYKARFPTD